jgi:hypothetical protein
LIYTAKIFDVSGNDHFLANNRLPKAVRGELAAGELLFATTNSSSGRQIIFQGGEL